MSRTRGERRLARASQRGQIIDQVTQHEQIDEVTEAIVAAANRSLAHRVQLLGDLETQRQTSDHPRTREPEVLQADRIDVLGLIGAVLRPGDLELAETGAAPNSTSDPPKVVFVGSQTRTCSVGLGDITRARRILGYGAG